MTLARFLAEVRTRARAAIPDSIDPLGVILSRVGVNPHTTESRALRKATLAVIATEGDMADADMWALGKDALGLLDAFALRRLAGQYTAVELEIFGGQATRRGASVMRFLLRVDAHGQPRISRVLLAGVAAFLAWAFWWVLGVLSP